jgi:hypothetical protein
MNILAPIKSKPSPWQVTVGAEGIAAAQFARCGFDVSIQSGHEKPWYDLVVAKAGSLLKVSVKGSEDGSWALTEAYTKRAADLNGKRPNARGAIDLWLDHHGARTLCCLVQFQGVTIDELPRIYLATPIEVAEKLRQTADRLGSPILYEEYQWESVLIDAPAIERLPSQWGFSERRIHELLSYRAPGVPAPSVLHKGPTPIGSWPPAADPALSRQEPVALSA